MFPSFIRNLSTTVQNLSIKPQICIVGSGPAGFYAAQQLANKCKQSQVDIYERLPVPFGLVRYGVAPDHQDLKRCTNTFTKTAQLPNVRFLGNIQLGKDVTLQQLRQAYHIVLLTYGVDDGRSIGVPGERLNNVFKAKNFVGWYNGLPREQGLELDLRGPRAAVFGHGNVAIDVARVLLAPIDRLRGTDMTERALAGLAASRVEEVALVGRRGPLQVAFTTKELRELFSLGVRVEFREEQMRGVEEAARGLVRPRKRLTELLVGTFNKSRTGGEGRKRLKLVFQRSPNEIIGESSVSKVKYDVNELVGADLVDKRAKSTGLEEVIDTDLVISSVGYKSVQVDFDIPFDSERGVIKCDNGRLFDGVYAAGWVARGPQGVLIDTMQHAFGVAGVILDDLNKKRILVDSKPGFELIKTIVGANNLQVVEWADWERIDKVEKTVGAKLGKPREKIVDVLEMLRIASS